MSSRYQCIIASVAKAGSVRSGHQRKRKIGINLTNFLNENPETVVGDAETIRPTALSSEGR